MSAYQVPGGLSPDVDALSALASVLGAGRSSRLYDSLVRQQQIAVQVYAGLQPSRRDRGSSISRRWLRPGRIPRTSRRRSTPRSRRCRRGRFRTGSSRRRATRRGAVSSAISAARCSARFCSRVTRVFFDDPGDHQHALRAHRVVEDRGPAARGAAISRADESHRGDHVPAPKPGCRREGRRRCAMKTAALLSALCSLPCSWRCSLVQAPLLARRARRRPTAAEVQRQGAGQQRGPEDQAAARAGGAALERRASDGARRPSRAVDPVPDHHDWRRRLLRSDGPARASPTRPRR